MAPAGPRGSRRRCALPHHEGLMIASERGSSSYPTLTLPRTIAALLPGLHHARLQFRDTYEGANAATCIARGPFTMDMNRRRLIGTSAAGVAGALAMSPDAARAAPLISTLGRDVTQYGVRPGSPDDQTVKLQRAIDEAARAQAPLALPPGVYRTGLLRLQSGTQLVGVRGATKLIFSGGASMLQGEGANNVGLTGITFDGGGISLPERRGLVHCLGGRAVRIADCEIAASGGNGIWLEQAPGDITGNIFTEITTTAGARFDAKGRLVSRNTVCET